MDRLSKKQLQWALEAKELSTQGTKANLELRLKERLDLEGMDIAEFYLEEVEAEETGAKEQVSMSDLMALMTKNGWENDKNGWPSEITDGRNERTIE